MNRIAICSLLAAGFLFMNCTSPSMSTVRLRLTVDDQSPSGQHAPSRIAAAAPVEPVVDHSWCAAVRGRGTVAGVCSGDGAPQEVTVPDEGGCLIVDVDMGRDGSIDGSDEVCSVSADTEIVVVVAERAAPRGKIKLALTPTVASSGKMVTGTWSLAFNTNVHLALRLYSLRNPDTTYWSADVGLVAPESEGAFEFTIGADWPGTDFREGAAYRLAAIINGIEQGGDTLVVLQSDGVPEPLPEGCVQWPAANGGNGHSYAIATLGTWTSAEAYAVQLGGHLVTIDDAAEMEFLRATFLVPALNSSDFWIGLYSPAGEWTVPGNWLWVGGASSAYRNWRLGQPDLGYEDGEDDRYATMNFRRNGDPTWDNYPNSVYRLAKGIIEFDGPDCR